jgi:hypothetical protein
VRDTTLPRPAGDERGVSAAVRVARAAKRDGKRVRAEGEAHRWLVHENKSWRDAGDLRRPTPAGRTEPTCALNLHAANRRNVVPWLLRFAMLGPPRCAMRLPNLRQGRVGGEAAAEAGVVELGSSDGVKREPARRSILVLRVERRRREQPRGCLAATPGSRGGCWWMSVIRRWRPASPRWTDHCEALAQRAASPR